MGSVWEGRHVKLGTRVAIKLIDADYLSDNDARTRFENEARAAAAIETKHAIRIYDHGIMDDGHPYIVMELLEGEPLDRRIERLGRISVQDAAKFIAHVCRALARAHASGIVHRDLKPDNIYLVADEDGEIAKLLDFGIAKFAPNAQNGISSGTRTGVVIGTPYYMSPEQARGLRSVDYRTDLWSLGVIAYACITGQLPFEGESTGDLLVKICIAPLPMPSRVVADVPAAFDSWFAKALAREPSERFQSAGELADSLNAIANGTSAYVAPSPAQAWPRATQHMPSPPVHVGVPTSHSPAYPAPYTPAISQSTQNSFSASKDGRTSKAPWLLVGGAAVAGLISLIAGFVAITRFASNGAESNDRTPPAQTAPTAVLSTPRTSGTHVEPPPTVVPPLDVATTTAKPATTSEPPPLPTTTAKPKPPATVTGKPTAIPLRPPTHPTATQPPPSDPGPGF